METDIDEEIMAVDDIEGEDDGVLSVPQEGHDRDVEGYHDNSNAYQDQ